MNKIEFLYVTTVQMVSSFFFKFELFAPLAGRISLSGIFPDKYVSLLPKHDVVNNFLFGAPLGTYFCLFFCLFVLKFLFNLLLFW